MTNSLQDAPSYPLTGMPYLNDDVYVIGYVPAKWKYTVLYNLTQLFGEDIFGAVSYSNPDTFMITATRDEDQDDVQWDQSLCYFDGAVQTMKLIFR